jgi:predicted enzyme related to lactoylglutathione lyase
MRMRTVMLALAAGLVVAAAPEGRVTGVGGVFVQSPNPKALAAWYRDVLGLKVEAWGGAMLPTTAPGAPPVVTWNAFRTGSAYFAPSKREFMINLAVDDLDAMVARLQQHHVPVLKREEGGETGRFAWIVDPDGTKVELWQPKAK